jgi:hypothetical protein
MSHLGHAQWRQAASTSNLIVFVVPGLEVTSQWARPAPTMELGMIPSRTALALAFAGCIATGMMIADRAAAATCSGLWR